MIDKDSIVGRLLALPQEMAAAEQELIAAETRKRAAVAALEDREADLLIAGVEGKNAEVRNALLRQATITERLIAEQSEAEATVTKALLHRLQTEHSSLRAVARLLAAGKD